MAQAWSWLLIVLSFAALAYGARSNICLAETSTNHMYKPLQLYPQDCPTMPANCMSQVYNYSAAKFKSLGPKTLMPNNRESLVYMTQDENDVLDIVCITATSYKNNVIKTIFQIDGAASGVQPIVEDDPTEDSWTWNPDTNRGNATWILQPTYTDGVVLGHIKIIDNFCFRVEFMPNWNGAITSVSFLTGTVAKPSRAVTRSLNSSSTFFEFCGYPKVMISKTDATCSTAGSATATSLSGSGTYLWTKGGVTVGTTSTINNLSAGTYTVQLTVAGCVATRDVTIASVYTAFTASSTVMDQTKTKPGKITLSISGGSPPYSIQWRKADGTLIATDVMTLNVQGGMYNITISDGCSTKSLSVSVNGPSTCPAGTYVSGDDCVPCVAGTYSTSVDSSMCTVCPPGKWNSQAGSTSCNTCPANTMTEGGSTMCSNCPANTVSDAGSAVCTPCSPGSARPTGASSCSPCPAGSYRCDLASACAACPAGTMSSAGARSCDACAPGSYSGSTGSTMCSSCPANSYAASGASSCTSCAGGMMAPMGSSVALACM